jgi:hypothetical protein
VFYKTRILYNFFFSGRVRCGDEITETKPARSGLGLVSRARLPASVSGLRPGEMVVTKRNHCICMPCPPGLRLPEPPRIHASCVPLLNGPVTTTNPKTLVSLLSRQNTVIHARSHPRRKIPRLPSPSYSLLSPDELTGDK